MTDKLIDLLKTSTLLQATLTLALLGVMVYKLIVNEAIPEILTNAFLVILGFYFGSKSQQVIDQHVAKIERKE
ncbi:MAG: hypothetical protein ROW48_18325 [Bellilinea sp.]|jgi:hypothetical protein